jgi:hypothetical protein
MFVLEDAPALMTDVGRLGKKKTSVRSGAHEPLKRRSSGPSISLAEDISK